MASDNSTPNTDRLLVVGIGASAGGLNAFSELLSHLPADTGMAFVLVQHLAADQNSLLGELLNRQTEIPVVQAEDGMTVEANQVYVIPPGARMTIAQGQLQLAERPPGVHHGKTIDTFLCSLAADRKNQAIAVILSGSNDDGAAGIRAIREQGGITFAQDRATTEFPIMPSAAIATGQVDFVLSPTQIATELAHISQHPYVRAPVTGDDTAPSSFGDDEFHQVFAILRQHTGVNFAQYKRKTFERRTRRRMALTKVPNLQDYIELLEAQPSEVQALYQDVLITVTDFFRDAATFTSLKEDVFAALLQRPSAQDSIRIWVAGCSTGEEVYSVAIGLLEYLDTVASSPTVQIFGTDVNERVIDEARTGQYLATRMAGVSPARRQRFFSEVNGTFYVNKSVRELCIFARHDLSSDPPFADIDLVTCRNALIYFQPALQHQILSLFHYSLKPQGFLLLGNSETLGEASAGLFMVYNSAHKIFRRAAGSAQINLAFADTIPRPSSLPERSLDFAVPSNRPNLQQWADRILLNRYAPVGVIIDEQSDILEFRGDTSNFLRHPAGEPSFNLLRMLRPHLLDDMRAAIKRARQQGVAVKRRCRQAADQSPLDVRLQVVPLSAPEGRYFLVLFEELPAAPAEGSQPVAPPRPAAAAAEVSQLRGEMAALRQELLDAHIFLQMTIEEQEATRQQLVAANEEVLSSNEELRSTNEELQTAKEEIQSSNEELQTTNEELQSRNNEWRRANDDLLNLINNVNIPILMLSSDLLIRSFSPAARQVFNLIPTDVGRPINNLRPNVDLPELERFVQEVIATLHTLEREVQDRDGRWYLLRVRPYRTLENRIDGAVLALIDIDNLRRTEEELRASQTQLQRELSVSNQMRLLSLQLFSSLDLQPALRDVLEAAIALLRADMGDVQLYDPERQELITEVQSGFEADEAAPLPAAATGDATDALAASRAFRLQRRVIVEDVQTDPNSQPGRDIMAAAGYRAVQATPLFNREGEVVGVLSTYFRQPQRPTDRELQLLDIYARQASEFICLVWAEQERQRLMEREQAALAANASKDEFLAVLSHELRTPLNSILGWIQMLEGEGLSEADCERAIATIRNSAQVQLQLIEDLLDASRMIQDRFSVCLQPTDVTAVARRAIALVRPQAEQKSLQLEQALAPSPELVDADPQRLEQVFQNLLTNAIKFTPEGGRITLRLTYSDTHITAQISDTGVGIAPDFLPYVFEQFRQADASNARRTGGLGLGLFLIRAIVEAHNGTVAVDSPGLDQGTTFTITLPRLTAAAPTPPAAPAAAVEALSLAGLRLLVVDDDETNIELYRYSLEDLGATVLVASSAADSLAILDREAVDLILSDIGLPVMNGYELLRAVRSRPANAGGEIPAIAISGYASQNDIQAALEAGFQIHLAKPVDLEEMAISIYSLTQE